MRTATKIGLAAFAAAVLGAAFATHAPHWVRKYSRKIDASRFMSSRPSLWWFEQRSFPTGVLPEAEYEAALKQALTDRQPARFSIESGPLIWQFSGPNNIGGRITAVNEKLKEHPELINSDPYGDGWILKLELTGELPGDLLDEAAYKKVAEA